MFVGAGFKVVKEFLNFFRGFESKGLDEVLLFRPFQDQVGELSLERQESRFDGPDKLNLVGQFVPNKSLEPVISVLGRVSKELEVLGKDDLECVLGGKLHGGI